MKPGGTHSGTTPVNDFGSAAGTITLNGDKSLGLTAVLTGDVDGLWAAPARSKYLSTDHFTQLATALQASDHHVSLARWGSTPK